VGRHSDPVRGNIRNGLDVERQKPIPLEYEDERVECAYRLDILVNKQVIVEVKSVVRLTQVHRAPMLSYLRLTGCQPGLVLNFNVNVLSRGGILRVVNGLKEE
jgi:GxxExxY protein